MFPGPRLLLSIKLYVLLASLLQRKPLFEAQLTAAAVAAPLRRMHDQTVGFVAVLCYAALVMGWQNLLPLVWGHSTCKQTIKPFN